MKAGHTAALLLVILAAALAVRMVGLGSESFWLDEGFAAQMAESASPREWAKDMHPPLYYALLSAWSHVDSSDAGLRFLSVLFGVLTIPVVYAIARRLFGLEAALWSALILSAAQLHVVYSQEARMYTLMVLLYAGILWGVMEVVYEGRARAGWVAYVACATLLVYSHGVGALYCMILAAIFLVMMLAKPGRGPWWWKYVAANLIVAALCAPWVGVMLARTRTVLGGFWIERPEFVMPVRIVLYDFAMPKLSGTLSQSSALAAMILPVKWLLPLPFAACMAVGVLRHERGNRAGMAAVFTAMLLPVAALYALSVTVRPVLLTRSALPAVAPYALALGAAVCVRKPWRLPARVLLTLGMIVLCTGTFLVLRQGQGKEGWKSASRYLQTEAKRGDVLLVYSTFGITEHTSEYLLQRYDPADELGKLRWVGSAPFLTDDGLISEDRQEELLERLREAPVFWVAEKRDGRKRILRDQLAELFAKIDEKEFNNIYVTKFVTPEPGEQPTSPGQELR